MEKSPHERNNPLRRAQHYRYQRPERIAPRTSSDVLPAPETEAVDTLAPGQKAKTARVHKATNPALPRLTRSFVLRREMVEEHAQEYRRKVRKKYGGHIVGVLIGLIVIAALGVIVWGFRDLIPVKLDFWHHAQTTTKEPAIVRTTSLSSSLDETPISSTDIIGHKMAADEPRSLSIPKLDIQARILRVGVSLDSEPIAPNNIYDVGWFEASGKPGNSAAVLLNGHSHGPTKAGVFANLKDLVPGDVVVLERGNGTRLTYIVHKVQDYPANQIDMTAALQSIEPGKQGLNLMTTPNKYNAEETVTAKRQVVFTVLQNL